MGLISRVSSRTYRSKKQVQKLKQKNMSKPTIAYDPITRTLQPSVTGSMIVGLKHKNGVFLAADTMGSYGGLRRFKDMTRVFKVNEHCMVAASGDLADFQELERIILDQVREDEV